jgi:hypothetical protein
MFVPRVAHKNVKRGILDLFIGGKESPAKKLGEIYSLEVTLFSILNVIASSLYICFAMYSANIFIERKKSIDVHVNKFGKLLYRLSYPCRKLSQIIIFMVACFDGSIVYAPKYDKNTLIFWVH